MQILTLPEREQIAYSLRLKRGIREIARLLRRDHTVIIRELKRNRLADDTYDPHRAQKRADLRAQRTNTRKLETDWRLHDWVERQLKAGWSPERIAGRSTHHPPKMLQGATISHEQLYAYIYAGEGRWEGWYHLLHRKHRRRHRRYGRKPQNTRIPERISIHDRPAVVSERGRVGDWESDEVQFVRQRERLSVQYERKTMLIRFHRVRNKTASENERAIAETLNRLPVHLRRSVTFDNGTENVCHVRIRDVFGVDTYFCDPYAAWQKGGVENVIGLIRRYLPRQTELATVSDADLRQIQEQINNLPRKKLNYQTPNEAWGGALNS